MEKGRVVKYPISSTVAALAVLIAGCGKQIDPNQQLNASGSTLIAPLMDQWTAQYAKDNGVRVTYNANGSGTGIRQFLDQSVDFCCSDAPLSDQELEQARKGGGEVAHIPLILGAVVPAYNLPEVDPNLTLRFYRPSLADIFLGKRAWNDPRLQGIQEDSIILPDRAIGVVIRSDSSGTTTYIFASYLSRSVPNGNKARPRTSLKFRPAARRKRRRCPRGRRGSEKHWLC